MSSGVVDVRYSIERWVNATWGATYDIAYEGAAFRQEDSVKWIYLTVFGPTGEPSRGGEYWAKGRISLRVVSRNSNRDAEILAQVLEEALRGGTIPVYDETNKTTVLGYIRLMDPAYQSLAERDGLHQGVLDTEFEVHMDL